MAIRPTLHRAIEKTKNTASDYNDNFDMMMDFIDDTLKECKDYVDDFMPDVTGQAGKVLTTDGTNTTWGVAVPIGTVEYYGGSVAPSGWLVCDGSAISRTTYAALFSAIGDTYGEGDGSTTFNLPDLIDKFIQGHTTVGTDKAAGLPNIIGYFSGGNDYQKGTSGAFYFSGGSSIAKSGTTYTGGRFNFDASRDDATASQANGIYRDDCYTVQPPALTMLPIIKY